MRTLVDIPDCNEVQTLQRVAELAVAADEHFDLSTVDDGSPDGTGQLADHLADRDERIHVVHRSGKQGLGSANRFGLQWELEQGYETLCEMDADLSHDPNDLPRLTRALHAFDVAIGSRYVRGGSVVNWPARRRLLSKDGNRYVRVMTGLPVAHATAGLRAYRRTVLKSIDLTQTRSEGYAFQLEMTFLAWRAGHRIREVPIRFVEWQEGTSKMHWGIVAEAVISTARWGWEARRRRPQPVGPAPVDDTPAVDAFLPPLRVELSGKARPCHANTAGAS
jgi:dolichol-phosphate mannosyltransferase